MFKLSIHENPLLHGSQTWGFSPVCVRRCFFKWSFRRKAFMHISHTLVYFLPDCDWRYSFRTPSSEFFCYIFYKYEAFHPYVFGNASLSYFCWEILCCIFHKHEAFPQYVSRDVDWGCSLQKIFFCIFHKHEAFTLYVFGNASLIHFAG